MTFCQAPGCNRRVKGYSRFCGPHRHRNCRHGDPLQSTVTTARLQPYVLAIRRYVERSGGDEMWNDLEALYDGLVRRARGIVADYRAGRPSFRQEVAAAGDLITITAEAPARRCIETVAAMVLMQEQDARAFRSDRAFWMQVSRRVRGLASRHAVKYLGRDGRTHRVYRDANPLAAVTLGRWLCEAVGLLGIGAARAAEAERKRLNEARVAVYAAMNGTSASSESLLRKS